MKIAIVNDSALAREAIRRAVLSDPRHRVIWSVADGIAALEACARQPPDLILMDMLMPGLDGVEATRRIMHAHPCPILIVTGSVQRNCGLVFDAMGAGALDVVATPPLEDEAGRRALLDKIALLERLTHAPRATPRPARTASAPAAVLIGASAGGPGALAEVLADLPSDLPAALVIVQHIDERFAGELAQWLQSRSALSVRGAREGDELRGGGVLLAVRAEHLIVRGDGRLGYTPEPADAIYRPSVDHFFTSAAALWRQPLVGVLLTGMGRDGAAGLLRLREAGHPTIAQDRETSALYGMPKAAAELGAAQEILPLPRIARRIVEVIRSFA